MESLELEYVDITDKGIAAIKHLKKLKILSLIGCKVTDAAVEDLSQLRLLEVLYCRGTKITPDGFSRLKNALPITRVFR